MFRSAAPSRFALAASISLAAASAFAACEAARATVAPDPSSALHAGQVTGLLTRAEPDTPEPTYVAGVNVPLWIDDFDGDTAVTDSAANGLAGAPAGYVTLNAGFIHLDPGAGIGGSAAVRFDWIRSTACTDDSRLIEHVFPDSPEVFVQFSVRYTPGFVFDWRGNGPCVGNAKKILFLWARSGSRFDLISENHVIGAGSDNDHPLFSQSIGEAMTPEQLADGQWHRFTFHVRQSSTPTATDGFLEGWIDGRLKWTRTGIATYNSGGYYDFKLPTTFNQGSPANQSEWLDNLRIWR